MGIIDAEAFDRGEDFVGGLCPSERLWIGVMLVDEGGDVGLKFGDATMDTAAYFFVGEQGEEPLDLIEP